MSVEWQESYKIGDAAVDAMQQQLFALTNAFLASDDLTVLRSTIVSLCKQARVQFELEEALDAPRQLSRVWRRTGRSTRCCWTGSSVAAWMWAKAT